MTASATILIMIASAVITILVMIVSAVTFIHIGNGFGMTASATTVY